MAFSKDSCGDSLGFTMNLKNATLEQFLSEIEKNSEYVFFYNENALEKSSLITIEAQNLSLSEILDKVLKPRGLDYTVKNRQITIFKSVNQSISGDDEPILVKGIVTDVSGVPLPGVTIRLKNSDKGTITDIDGNFSIYVPTETSVLQFTYIGYVPQEITAPFGSRLNIRLQEDSKQIEEVVVVGYGKQKKMTVTGAVSMAEVKEMAKVATPSLSNAIAGQLPGIISRQASGEPGHDAAQIYIRGIATWGNQNPLILIDGVERDLNQINAQEVESFTILKDASATAVYGARGANGVILITTKRGQIGKPEVTFRSETAVLTALRRPEYIDAYSYASLMNEARIYNGEEPRWTAEELQKYKDGSDPYLYPNVNWMNEVMKKNTMQTINNLSVSGGTDIIKYYMNVGFTYQNGLYREDPNNDFGTNSNMKRYNFRNNFDVKLSKNLTMQLSLGAIIQNGRYPGFSTSEIFKAINMVSPIAYPKLNPDGTPGGSQTYIGHNPWGRSTQSGYSTEDHATIQASFGATWDLSFLLKGLSIRGLFSYDRYSVTVNNRPKDFVVKRYLGKDPVTGEDLYSPIYREEQPMGYSQATTANRAQYFEGQINYDRTFGEHNVTAMLLFNQREYIDLSAEDSRANIPYRRLGLAGRVTYNYANKYFAPFARQKAGPLGKKMALGVIFYGLAKEYSKNLVTTPVHWLTGVDTNLPYAKVNYELPDDIYDTDITSIEYHKVFESVEFPRWDLLYKDSASGKPRNAYYDKVAKKLGLGTNLKDSDQEVKPRIKEIVVKTNLAQNISSYLWAATGVALAFQKPWEEFFNVATLKFWQKDKFKQTVSAFFKSLLNSMESFYYGEGSKHSKYMGRGLLFAALGSSFLGVINVMSSSQKPSKLDSADIIEKERKYVVN